MFKKSKKTCVCVCECVCVGVRVRDFSESNLKATQIYFFSLKIGLKIRRERSHSA